MKICILTQTAEDISDAYKTFFKGFDLYFLTFKVKNDRAIDFMPNSSWSAGRNRLWEEVRGKYDYYLFIDDDLDFYKAKFGFIPQLQYIAERLSSINSTYSRISGKSFFSKIESYLLKYGPEILTVRNINNQVNNKLDYDVLKQGGDIRRLGWFDAQFTIFSNYAAEHLLPYDTGISGWASAQILIYLLSYYVFASKALGIITLGVNNSFHTGEYVPDYKSNLDCKNMIAEICKATQRNFNDLYDEAYNHVNLYFGKESLNILPNKNDSEEYKKNFLENLSGIESLMNQNNLLF